MAAGGSSAEAHALYKSLLNEVGCREQPKTTSGVIGVDPKNLKADPMDQTTGVDPLEAAPANGDMTLKTATVGLQVPETVTPSNIGDQDLGLSPSQVAAAAQAKAAAGVTK